MALDTDHVGTGCSSSRHVHTVGLLSRPRYTVLPVQASSTDVLVAPVVCVMTCGRIRYFPYPNFALSVPPSSLFPLPKLCTSGTQDLYFRYPNSVLLAGLCQRL